jgi:hypothetical protein
MRAALGLRSSSSSATQTVAEPAADNADARRAVWNDGSAAQRTSFGSPLDLVAQLRGDFEAYTRDVYSREQHDPDIDEVRVGQTTPRHTHTHAHTHTRAHMLHVPTPFSATPTPITSSSSVHAATHNLCARAPLPTRTTEHPIRWPLLLGGPTGRSVS